MEINVTTGNTARAVEPVSATSFLSDYYKDNAPKIMQLIAAYYDYLGKQINFPTTELSPVPGTGGASFELGNLTINHDIDTASDYYLSAIGKEIAANVPQPVGSPDNPILDKRRLYKVITRYYNTRGSDDSVIAFFRIFYNEVVTLLFPKEFLLNSSATQSLLNSKNKSGNIIRDSYYWQEYSYVINSPTSAQAWINEFNRFVHPAGLKLFINLTTLAVAYNDWLEEALNPATGSSWDGYIYLQPEIQDVIETIPREDYWKWIDWDKFYGKHSPKQQHLQHDRSVLSRVLTPDGGKHYLTHIKTVFNCPPTTQLGEDQLRALYNIIALTILSTNLITQSNHRYIQYLGTTKYTDFSAHLEGFGDRRINQTFERTGVRDLEWSWSPDELQIPELGNWTTSDDMTDPVEIEGRLQATIIDDTNPYFLSPQLEDFGIDLSIDDIEEIEFKFTVPPITYDTPTSTNTDYPVKLAINFITDQHPGDNAGEDNMYDTAIAEDFGLIQSFNVKPSPWNTNTYRVRVNMRDKWNAGVGVNFTSQGRESYGWSDYPLNIETSAEVPTGLFAQWWKHNTASFLDSPTDKLIMDSYFDPTLEKIGVAAEDGQFTHTTDLNWVFLHSGSANSTPTWIDTAFDTPLNSHPEYLTNRVISSLYKPVELGLTDPIYVEYELSSFSLQYTGFIHPLEGGDYLFRIYSDDAGDITIGDSVVASWYGTHDIDDTPGPGEFISTTINLCGEKYYPFKVRATQKFGNFGLRVEWLTPSNAGSGTWETIPVERLHQREPQRKNEGNQLRRIALSLPHGLNGGSHAGTTGGDRTVSLEYFRIKRALDDGIYGPTTNPGGELKKYNPGEHLFDSVTSETFINKYEQANYEYNFGDVCEINFVDENATLPTPTIIGAQSQFIINDQYELGLIETGVNGNNSRAIRIVSRINFYVVDYEPGSAWNITSDMVSPMVEINHPNFGTVLTLQNQPYIEILNHVETPIALGDSERFLSLGSEYGFNFYEGVAGDPTPGTPAYSETFSWNFYSRLKVSATGTTADYIREIPSLTVIYNAFDDNITYVNNRHEYTILTQYLNSLVIHDDNYATLGIESYENLAICTPSGP